MSARTNMAYPSFGTRSCWGLFSYAAMMSFLCLLALGGSGCAGQSSSIGAPKTIQVAVTGIGSSFDEAKEDGLKKAILSAQGALVITERRIVNDILDQEDISYTNGLIRSYQVLNTQRDSLDSLLRVYMRVTVTSTPMGKRILYSGDASTVNGGKLTDEIDRARQQLDSERQRRASSMRLLEHLMSEFPFALLDVEKPRIESYSENGRVHLRAKFTATVNRAVFTNVCNAARYYSETQLENPSRLTHTRLPGSNYFEQGGFLGCGLSKAIYIPDESWNSWTSSLEETGFCLTLVDRSNVVIAKQFTPAKLRLFDDGIVAREYRDFLTRNLGFLGTVYGKVRYEVQVDEWMSFADRIGEIQVWPSSTAGCGYRNQDTNTVQF